jgi:nitric oxide reductase large subunit
MIPLTRQLGTNIGKAFPLTKRPFCRRSKLDEEQAAEVRTVLKTTAHARRKLLQRVFQEYRFAIGRKIYEEVWEKRFFFVLFVFFFFVVLVYLLVLSFCLKTMTRQAQAREKKKKDKKDNRSRSRAHTQTNAFCSVLFCFVLYTEYSVVGRVGAKD